MTATIEYAKANRGPVSLYAQVTIAHNGAPQTEVHALAKEAFASLGVEMDPLANSYRSSCTRDGYSLYSQAVPA
jgi:hypothetical protein